MGNLASEVDQASKRTYRTDLLIERSLKPKELAELHELLRDDFVQLTAVHRVLIRRGIRLSYSSLHRYRESLRAQ